MTDFLGGGNDIIITFCEDGKNDDRESLAFEEFSCIFKMYNGGNHFATAIRFY